MRFRWKPKTCYERLIPKEMLPFALVSGYEKVDETKREEWLRSRFLLPAGWEPCERYTRLGGLRRTTAVIWKAVQGLVPTVSTRGRPSPGKQRLSVLWEIFHSPDVEVRAQLAWPLLQCALSNLALSPQTRLWLLVRPGVLTPMLCRTLARAWAEDALGAVAGPEVVASIKLAVFSALDKLVDVTISDMWSRYATYSRTELQLLLSSVDATLVNAANAVIEVFDPVPVNALQKVLGYAGQVFEDRADLKAATQRLLDVAIRVLDTI